MSASDDSSSTLTFEQFITKLTELSIDPADFYKNYVESTCTYVVGRTPAPFDMWLEANMPSRVREGDDIPQFVGVLRPRYKEKQKPDSDTYEEESSSEEEEESSSTDDDECDSSTDDEETVYPPHVMRMLAKFSKEISSGKEITKQLVFDLAVEFGITTGKWMLIPVPTGVKVDVLWTKIARSIVDGSIPGCHYAKVSTMTIEKMLGNNNPSHVICIYNDNFLDMDEVRALESGIRAIGIRGKLSYKPDIFTYCGVYRNNRWKITPVIYQSNYDVKSKQSKIDVF
ncbi:UPF0696 protein C11orf68 homolog isoform X2 [Argopecten irradians]|uniref:UPF0696 protein C11orf68 homolog isoform X2 n=1 Tax=Argopecten irradians TaxID=31199 RepID=UPI00371551E4